MWIRGQPGIVRLLPEVQQFVLSESVLEESSGVNPRTGMALDVDCISDSIVLLASEDMVESDFI